MTEIDKETNSTVAADIDKVIEKIDQFLDGTDTSLKNANEIEVCPDDSFPDDELIADAVIMLALYTPGGGEFLFNEEQMQATLLGIRKYLLRKR